MKHLHFVVNPAAAGSTCIRRFSALQPMLERRGINYSVVYSEYPGHVTELVQQAITADVDCVVAVGGDGTAREVAEALVHTGIPMGILPIGTGNDLIRALKIPANLDDAVELLISGTPRPVDAATANDRVYLNVAGFGFDVKVLERTKHYKKKLQGLFPYILGLLHALIHLRSWNIQVTTDGETYSQQALVVAVGNGTHIGGGMMVTPLAVVDDGLLDVCIIKSVGRMQLLRALRRFIGGKHLEMEITRYFKVTELTVKCGSQAQLQLDGEIMLSTPVTFCVLPHALEIITG